MIQHLSIGEETEGEFKGKPYIKVICDAESLQVLMGTFGQVMQASSIITQINQALGKSIDAIKAAKAAKK